MSHTHYFRHSASSANSNYPTKLHARLTQTSDNQPAMASASVAMRHSLESTAVNTPFDGGSMQWEQEKVAAALRKLEEPVVIDWVEGDPENPFNWPVQRKYLTTLVSVFLTTLSACNATTLGVISVHGAEHFGVSTERFALSSTVFVLAIAFTPLVLAPLSEVFGRNPIYQVTSILGALLFLPQALSSNFGGLLAARWFQGMVSSVGNSMVGGTIADLFAAQDRGIPMSVYSIMVFFGQSVGSVAVGWVGMRFGIHWIYGAQGLAGVFSCILNALVLRETRGDVLLSRKARALTKQTGRLHVCRADLERGSMYTLLTVSIVRPMQYLFTEPIVIALSCWVGFAWGIIFLSGVSILLVFDQYGFNSGVTGSFLITILIGGLLGFGSNFHQEKLYQRAAKGGKAPPEARLHWAVIGGLMFPLAMYWFAWVGQPSVHWIVPAIALVFVNWGIFSIYTGVFAYVADAYETYSSSAQAAQSLVRNLTGATFPLWGARVYRAMGYPQASTLVASLGLLLSVAPMIIMRYGPVLRAKSRVASQLSQ